MLQQFDKVRIVTTKQIYWISHPSEVKPIPHGEWSVICIIDKDALICRGGVICRVPISDIEKLSVRYNSGDHNGQEPSSGTKGEK